MKPLLLCIYLALLPMLAQAHGPTPQKAKESIVIDAPPAKVWEVVKDFDRIADWHPGVSASSGDGGNEAGVARKITLENGGVLEESLDYYSDADHEYSYRLKAENLEALPVSFYTASLQLSAEGDKTLVNWKGRFYRGDTSNFPPENLNDAAAVKAMTDFIRQGLAGLKSKFE
ncbi:SRPBCC family protein [Methylomarinum vadi]|uniref:SRPBCC family protein n=1 Tax=Methylomarinum vadi TaxID=438855 RepID=UPI0004DF2448|nr:SRPBCC family protein [Methylomarinum vadi]